MDPNQAVIDQEVPDEVYRKGTLPPLRWKDLPEPAKLGRMLGPSIILAGLALGSGEFVIWPKITFHTGFIFFWACIIGVTIQYFINMEITRYTLATGETAITGFCRLSRHWAWIFLIFNFVPWFIPAWATAGAQLLNWAVVPSEAGLPTPSYTVPIAIGTLFGCGILLTAGPVVYHTLEKTQAILVAVILLLVVVLAAMVVRGDAVAAMASGLTSPGLPELNKDITPTLLLGALAFAGVGGTLNLGQSNYVKDKGYGMGQYIGRITSPITGHAEAIAETGYLFPQTKENCRRWRAWWRRARFEHFLTFYVTCVICLVLLTLIAYSIFYRDGQRVVGADAYEGNLQFLWGEAVALSKMGSMGSLYQTMFLWMGVAILFTTELAVLDATSRISADILKVNWLRKSTWWSESRLYGAALWTTIVIGSALLLWAGADVETFKLVKIAAALNGGVMFFYCVTLICLNRFRLPFGVRMGPVQFMIMIAATLFFGGFTAWTVFTHLQAFWDWLMG